MFGARIWYLAWSKDVCMSSLLDLVPAQYSLVPPGTTTSPSLLPTLVPTISIAAKCENRDIAHENFQIRVIVLTPTDSTIYYNSKVVQYRKSYNRA